MAESRKILMNIKAYYSLFQNNLKKRAIILSDSYFSVYQNIKKTKWKINKKSQIIHFYTKKQKAKALETPTMANKCVPKFLQPICTLQTQKTWKKFKNKNYLKFKFCVSSWPPGTLFSEALENWVSAAFSVSSCVPCTSWPDPASFRGPP